MKNSFLSLLFLFLLPAYADVPPAPVVGQVVRYDDGAYRTSSLVVTIREDVASGQREIELANGQIFFWSPTSRTWLPTNHQIVEGDTILWP